MIFTYQNRESSLNNKTNTKEKINIIVAGYKAPSSNIPPNRSTYTSIRVGNTEPANFSRSLAVPQRNPIKHYRRELTHDSYKTSSLKQIIKDFNAPGKTIVTNNRQNDNNLNNWTQNQNAPAKSWTSTALNNDGSKIVATSYISGNIYRSNDSGVTWIQTSAPFAYWWKVASSDNGLINAAITLDGLNGKIYMSSDYGVTWTLTSAPYKEWISIAMSGNGNIIAALADNGKIYVSNNFGATWIAYSQNKYWSDITINQSGSNLAACAYGDVIYTSANSGVDWTATASGTKNWASISMNSSGNQIVAGVQGEYIYISTDYGFTWEQKGSPQISSTWYVSTSGDGSIIVAANLDAGIYVSYSSTNFNTWKQIVNTINWFDIQISRNGNAAYAVNPMLQVIWNTLSDYSSNKSCYFKDEIYPNNEKCRDDCNKKNNITRPAQTNMSRNYSSSMSNLMERRGITYKNNQCNNNQKIIKNSTQCNNQNDAEFTTSKNKSVSTTTSISSYRRQYNQNYTDGVSKILNNNICCNIMLSDNSIYNHCNPHNYPNIKERKTIC